MNDNGVYDKFEYKSALRCVQRYLKSNVLQRGKTTNSIYLNPAHVAWRNKYIRLIMENRAKSEHLRLQEVYSDESYIHHHHHYEKGNLFLPEDKYEKNNNQKGRRICFIAAIFAETNSNYAVLVPNSYWRFTPTRLKLHQGDYHRAFKSMNYLNWIF